MSNDVPSGGHHDAATPVSVEEASLRAWPAIREELVDGWTLRFGRGFTKRANCVIAHSVGRMALDEKIRHCERAYAREGQPTIFRLTSISPETRLGDVLTDRGYETVGQTDVLSLRLDRIQTRAKTDVRLLGPDAWLETYVRLTEMSRPHSQAQAAILERIRGRCLFAVIGDSSEPAACGFGVVDGGLLGLFDVVTHPAKRDRGHGRTLVTSLLAEGSASGASTAYLQVETANRPAAALYRGVGFVPTYRYSYRTRG